MAKGAGISLGLMVLAALAFVLGFWTGTQNEPDLAYDHLVWEAVIKVGFAALCGAARGRRRAGPGDAGHRHAVGQRQRERRRSRRQP